MRNCRRRTGLRGTSHRAHVDSGRFLLGVGPRGTYLFIDVLLATVVSMCRQQTCCCFTASDEQGQSLPSTVGFFAFLLLMY